MKWLNPFYLLGRLKGWIEIASQRGYQDALHRDVKPAVARPGKKGILPGSALKKSAGDVLAYLQDKDAFGKDEAVWLGRVGNAYSRDLGGYFKAVLLVRLAFDLGIKDK